ncbi:aminotransferase class IV [Stenotrophomonas sp. NRRL B-14846]|uniref:aminotransferase class IV n=1 Tax=Stenotrophomonas sp. NRRL B-14846 TaxID=3162882 RepID=UPI003D283F9D
MEVRWDKDAGWHNANVRAYGRCSWTRPRPCCTTARKSSRHQGLPPRRRFDLDLPPRRHGRRLQRSAQRLALPELPVEIFVESLKQLIAVDSAWVPSADESSLYFRPFMIGDEAFLGVRGAHKAGYYVIASPAGPYSPRASLRCRSGCRRSTHVRARAAPVRPSAVATTPPRCCRSRRQQAQGCSQVLFLDPVEGKYLEELGGMNVFLVYKDGTLVTPELSGSILEGITRESILQLARDRGMKVEERKVSIDEWKDGVASGAISEVFACGTAAVVTRSAS